MLVRICTSTSFTVLDIQTVALAEGYVTPDPYGMEHDSIPDHGYQQPANTAAADYSLQHATSPNDSYNETTLSNSPTANHHQRDLTQNIAIGPSAWIQRYYSNPGIGTPDPIGFARTMQSSPGEATATVDPRHLSLSHHSSQTNVHTVLQHASDNWTDEFTDPDLTADYGYVENTSRYPPPEPPPSLLDSPYYNHWSLEPHYADFNDGPTGGVESLFAGSDPLSCSPSTSYPPTSYYSQHHITPVEEPDWDDCIAPYTQASTPETTYDLKAKSRRPPPAKRGKTRESSLQRSSPGISVDCSEPNCKRRFRLTATNSLQLCKRHQDKYNRNHAGPPTFQYLPYINSFDAARQTVYVRLDPLNLEEDDVDQANDGDFWVNLFINAANTPYVEGSDYHEFHARQQTVYNGKAYKEFDDEKVNVRMRFLYQAALTFHNGGDSVYPRGGDNEGYGDGYTPLKFSDRLNTIVGILTLDKRVCMDVIEGRGVIAFVKNPQRYEKRKTQNKDSNEKKQRKQQLGDLVEQKRAAKRKAKGKESGDSEEDSEEYSEDERSAGEEQHNGAAAFNTPASLNTALDADGGYEPSSPPAQLTGKKRKRQTPSRTATAPTSRPSKKAKTTVAKQKVRDLAATTPDHALQLVDNGEAIEATSHPLDAGDNEDVRDGAEDEINLNDFLGGYVQH